MFDKTILNVYFVAGTQDCRHLSDRAENNLLSVLEQALRAGITCYQFREKGNAALQDIKQIKKLAAECRALCAQYNIPFVVNNDVQLAIELNADGIHLGQRDMAVEQAKSLSKGKLFVGISNSELTDIHHSLQTQADYFAAGPIFQTFSKADAHAPVGIDFIRQIIAMQVNKPLVAIGGITTANVQAIRLAGADGIAVVSAIAQATNIHETVNALLN